MVIPGGGTSRHRLGASCGYIASIRLPWGLTTAASRSVPAHDLFAGGHLRAIQTVFGRTLSLAALASLPANKDAKSLDPAYGNRIMEL